MAFVAVDGMPFPVPPWGLGNLSDPQVAEP